MKIINLIQKYFIMSKIQSPIWFWFINVLIAFCKNVLLFDAIRFVRVKWNKLPICTIGYVFGDIKFKFRLFKPAFVAITWLRVV